MGNRDSALEYYNRALEIDPTYATALSNKATIYMDWRMFPQAKELLLRAIQDPNAYNNLGVIEREMGNLGAAEDYFKKAGDNKWAKYNLENLYKSMGVMP